MIFAVDAHYGDEVAAVACVVFDSWEDPEPRAEYAEIVERVAPYVPGEFWRRELPCIMAILGYIDSHPDILLIDGYVWLDQSGRQGLGSHVYCALDGATSVVGIAKTAFKTTAQCHEVLRGTSCRPLYVSSQGIPNTEAARGVASMHGEFRIPTLLRRVDQLCRKKLRTCVAKN